MNPCDSFVCQVYYVHTSMCVTYSHQPEDLFCAIPCFLSNCTKHVVHKWTNCPHWRCTSGEVPIHPPLPINHPMSVALIVLTIVGTILLTILVTMGIRKALKMRRRGSHQPLLDTGIDAPIYGKKYKIHKFMYPILLLVLYLI